MNIFRALGLLLAVLSANSLAASFDCSKAASFAEVSICKDGYLSSVDSILGRAYSKALEATADPQALRQSQREWLATRDACTTQKCLDTTLGARVTYLDNYASNEKSNAYNAQQQQRAAQHQAEEAERERVAEHARATAQAAQRAAPQPQASAPAPATPAVYAPSVRPAVQAPAPQPEKSAWKKFIDGPAWKYACLMVLLLSCWTLWRHHQGSTTLYNDYTDAAISNGIPLSGLIIAGLCKWLELPGELAWIVAASGLVLAVAYVVYASVRVNQGGLNITLAIITKLFFISVFYAVIGMLVASLFVGTKYKGESQARANARNRREKKQTMAQIAALSAGYTALTIWLCRRPHFTSLSECLDFDLTPQPA